MGPTLIKEEIEAQRKEPKHIQSSIQAEAESGFKSRTDQAPCCPQDIPQNQHCPTQEASGTTFLALPSFFPDVRDTQTSAW